MINIQEKEIIKDKLRNKKGILIFDMDGVLNTFVKSYDLNDITNYYTAYDEERFIKDDVNKLQQGDYLSFQGIVKELIDYLVTLKKDYVLMTNTSWGANHFDDLRHLSSTEGLCDMYSRYKTHFPLGLFDLYGGHAGRNLTISISNPLDTNLRDLNHSRIASKYFIDGYENIKKDIETSSKDEKGHSHLLNKYIFDIIEEMKSNNELIKNFRMIQFEDEWNGSVETPEYVFLDFHSYVESLNSGNNHRIIEDNTDYGYEFYNIYGEDSVDNIRKDYNANNKTYTTAFTADGCAVKHWLERNLH